jgi:hypothetical protein
VIYFARAADGTPVASAQSSASAGFYWRAPLESQSRIRFVNLDDDVMTANWLMPDGVGGNEPHSSEMGSGSSSGWLLTPSGSQALVIDGVGVDVELAPGSWTTVFLVAGSVKVITEASAPESNTSRVRLVNASQGTIDGEWSGKSLGQVSPGGVSSDAAVSSKSGTLELDLDADGTSDLTFEVDGAGNDPALGLYYLGGAVPTVLVHRTETYLTVAYSVEATAWLRVVHVLPTYDDIWAVAPDLGLPETSLNTKTGQAQLSYGSLGPIALAPGEGALEVGGVSLTLTLTPGETATVVVHGDPSAPTVERLADSSTAQLWNLTTHTVDVAAKVGSDSVSLVTDLEPGQNVALTLLENTSGLLLDYDQDGTDDWQMYGPYFDPAIVLVYGDEDTAALLHFSPQSNSVGHVGQVL